MNGNNPYPNGLERVKIGDDAKLISEAYHNVSIKQNGTLYVVENEHSVFRNIFYFIDNDKITSIMFGLAYGNDFGKTALQDSLTQTFGAPKVTKRRAGDTYEWIVNAQYKIHFDPSIQPYQLHKIETSNDALQPFKARDERLPRAKKDTLR